MTKRVRYRKIFEAIYIGTDVDIKVVHSFRVGGVTYYAGLIFKKGMTAGGFAPHDWNTLDLEVEMDGDIWEIKGVYPVDTNESWTAFTNANAP